MARRDSDAVDKVRPGLARLAAARDDHDTIEVVIELIPLSLPDGPTRSARVKALQSAFEDEVSILRDVIMSVGGEITGEAWLNQTVRVQLPKDALIPIAAQDVVVAIDQPRSLTADVDSLQLD